VKLKLTKEQEIASEKAIADAIARKRAEKIKNG
jgi:hypothetical protein